MRPDGETDVRRHNIEIHENRRRWDRKPGLQASYDEFYRQIRARLAPLPGLVVELGSGIGAIKKVIPECVTTDLFPNPWLDRRENAYCLTFESSSVSNLILFDVWHHLRYPGSAMNEFQRVLVPGGRLILLEPAGSVLGRVIYRYLHHEGMESGKKADWDAPPGFHHDNIDYYTDQYAATRMFWSRRRQWTETPGWRLAEVCPLTSFHYWSQGGLSGPALVPSSLGRVMRAIDRAARVFPRLWAARLLVVVEKVA